MAGNIVEQKNIYPMATGHQISHIIGVKGRREKNAGAKMK
jgi:hypothetical protein